MIFQAFSLFAHSLISTQFLGQLCSSSLAYLILFRHFCSADIFFSSSTTFFLAFATMRVLAFVASFMLPLIFGAMVKSGWLYLVSSWLIFLGQFWSCGSGPTILYLNRCQSLLSSFIFIVGEGESCPIMSLMQKVVKSCSQIFIFGFGGNSSLVCMVGSVGPVDWSGSVRLVHFFLLGWFWVHPYSFSSNFLWCFHTSVFFHYLVRLQWLGICSCCKSTVMLFSKGVYMIITIRVYKGLI